MPRFFCPVPLALDLLLDLPEAAARHVQVLRLQPGADITLFNGQADPDGRFGEWAARVTRMGRSSVQVQVGAWHATQLEPACSVHLAVGMPANERMDWLVEKAAELGVASIWPLMTERSVLRLNAERAHKKQLHWQSVAVAACEQCGGNRVPVIHAVMTLAQWLAECHSANSAQANQTQRACVLSLDRSALPVRQVAAGAQELCFLSGPEGGLSAAEEAAARAHGFVLASLGVRVLRAETAALAVLAALLV